MRHQDLTTNHILESFVYANAAARTGATGFVPSDIGRIAYQTDTGQYWRLTATTPTWQFVPAAFYPQTVGAAGTLLRSTGTLLVFDASAGALRIATAILTLLTAGAPADLGSLVLPTWLTRWRISSAELLTVTSAGTIAAGTIAAYDAAGAGGNQILNATAPNNTAGQIASPAATSAVLTYTGGTLFIRQTANSAAAGTVAVYFNLNPMF